MRKFIVLLLTISTLLTILYFLLFARIIMSWFAANGTNKLMELLFLLTEPVIAPIRMIVSKFQSGDGRGMMFDLSPLITLLLVQFLRVFVNSI